MTTGEKFEKVADAVYEKGASDFGVPFDESGTGVVTINKVHPKEHDVDVTIESKNLIPFPYINMSVAHNGVTFTVNDDGTVTANGTAEGGVAYIIIASYGNNPLPAGTYTISGAPTADTYMTFSGVNAACSSGKSSTFTITEGKAQNMLTCCVYAGRAVENVVFKPQIEKGTVATPYAQYISDMSVVDEVNVLGKNLISPSVFADYELQEDGSYYAPYENNKDRQKYAFYLPAGTYTLSYQLKASAPSGYRICLKDKNGKTYYQYKIHTEEYLSYVYTFTASADIETIYMDWGTGSAMGCYFKDLQIENGNVATEYEPYKGNTYPVTDGKATIKSISPTMHIITPTNGVNINAKGYLDGNVVINELTQAMIDLGGEI